MQDKNQETAIVITTCHFDLSCLFVILTETYIEIAVMVVSPSAYIMTVVV